MNRKRTKRQTMRHKTFKQKVEIEKYIRIPQKS